MYKLMNVWSLMKKTGQKKNRIMSKELISFSKNYMKFAISKATSKRMDTQLAY